MGGNFKSPFRSLQSWRNWRELVMGGGIPWLLRDEFITNRAAGAVNGTPAEPGPGTRVVIDTGLTLSIAAGVATFAAGAYGDPGLWYGALARTVGRLLLWRARSTGANAARLGIDSNQVGAPVDFFSLNAGNILRVVSGGVNPSVGTWTVATDYVFAMAIRAAGLYAFVKGGAEYPDWVLLWVASAGATNPMYMQTTTAAPTPVVDFMRIPDELYIPTPLAYDSFTRANGPLGSTEVVGPDGQATTARVWNNRVGTTLVAGNTASASALVGGEAIATVDTGTADVLQGAELTRAGGNVGVVVRYTDATNYVIGYHDGINAKLDKVVAGVTTPVITAAAAYGAGRVLWIICEGTQFALYYNNVQIGATGTINDAGLQNGTEQGLYSTNVGNSQDDMLTMARGTNGEYSALNRYGG